MISPPSAFLTVKTVGGKGLPLAAANCILKNVIIIIFALFNPTWILSLILCYCIYMTVTKIFLYMIVRSGTILHIGHLDFYPSGGSVQPGCVFGIDAMPGGVCSHRRAIYYYFHSIRYTSIDN